VVEPYLPEESPIGCGSFDSPDALKEYRDSLPANDDDESPAAAWAKIIAGSFFGGFPGLVVGAVLTALEAFPPGSGITSVATGSGPVPKKKPTDVSFDGTEIDHGIIQPIDLNLQQLGFRTLNIATWNNDQNIEVEGRHYDFIVDRTKQIWWPSDDGKSGYRGRWGPLVVSDPFRRRSGMRFPEFWKMFFLALAKSK
jgi:hypothetical protein